MADAWTKVAAKTAAEICKRFPLSDEARPLLKDAAPAPFLAALLDKALFTDALRFVGHALPKREAVFWAYSCARQAAGADLPEPQVKALAVAHKWVLDPSEDNRRAAEAAWQVAEAGTPAGCTALAAFWSGGSMSPKDLPVVPPPDELTGHAAASAAMLAGIQTEPAKFADKYRNFAMLGVAIATGSMKWT